MPATVAPTAELAARGAAYALLARLLAADTRPLADPEHLDALRDALERAGERRALAHLEGANAEGLDADELARRWVRWFDHGRVAPYECSNTPPSPAGHTPRLADVAGFYKAFGLAVTGDRPDHVVAELEFASVVALAEASALERGDHDAAEVCASTARAFLRDHLGGWLDAFAARVGAVEALRPWAPVAVAAAAVVAADAARHNVVPIRPLAVLPDDAGIPDDEDRLPVCGADPID